jgi:SpoVK/Ycf46/Vps4 family AAA+-type ATPase
LDAATVSSYSELLEEIAKECDGYSGAALAGVARAAASHALESANGSMMDCLVTKEDFKNAVADVLTSTENSDYSEAANEEDKSDDELPLN